MTSPGSVPDAMTRRCPTCGIAAGQPCVDSRGQANGKTHLRRFLPFTLDGPPMPLAGSVPEPAERTTQWCGMHYDHGPHGTCDGCPPSLPVPATGPEENTVSDDDTGPLTPDELRSALREAVSMLRDHVCEDDDCLADLRALDAAVSRG